MAWHVPPWVLFRRILNAHEAFGLSQVHGPDERAWRRRRRWWRWRCPAPSQRCPAPKWRVLVSPSPLGLATKLFNAVEQQQCPTVGQPSPVSAVTAWTLSWVFPYVGGQDDVPAARVCGAIYHFHRSATLLLRCVGDVFRQVHAQNRLRTLGMT